MISDLNLEEKANELWRGFAPKNETDFWQAYAKCLTKAQQIQQTKQRQSMPVQPSSSTVATRATPKAPASMQQNKALAKTYTFYGKDSNFVDVSLEKQAGVWATVFLCCGLSYVFQFWLLALLAIVGLMVFVNSITDRGTMFELTSDELIIRVEDEGKSEKHFFYLQEIDEVWAGFHPHHDRYVFNVKTSYQEKNIAYDLSITDHQHFYDALKLHKVYVTEWDHPTI